MAVMAIRETDMIDFSPILARPPALVTLELVDGCRWWGASTVGIHT